MNETNKHNVFHLGLSYYDLNDAKIAIIPGDPKRVEKIAKLMLCPIHLNTNREFTSWLAKLGNESIVICSTGIGGSSTSIVVEELSQLGVRIFLRVGTTGAIQTNINVGDLIITTAAVRLDGASRHFAPIEFPAVADFNCTKALINAAKINQIKAHIGVTVSSDTFYPGQERYDTYSNKVIKRFKGSMKEWQNMGVMNYEMESSTLLTMCVVNKLLAGSITGVIVNRTHTEKPNINIVKKVEDIVINVVIDAARILLNRIESIL